MVHMVGPGIFQVPDPVNWVQPSTRLQSQRTGLDWAQLPRPWTRAVHGSNQHAGLAAGLEAGSAPSLLPLIYLEQRFLFFFQAPVQNQGACYVPGKLYAKKMQHVEAEKELQPSSGRNFTFVDLELKRYLVWNAQGCSQRKREGSWLLLYFQVLHGCDDTPTWHFPTSVLRRKRLGNAAPTYHN